MASTSKSGESSGSLRIEQVNDSLYELNQPMGRPSIQVLFFHGLAPDGDYSNAHWSTWQSEDGTCCWPQTWLVEEVPGAHVFCVSCNGCLGSTSTEKLDLFLQAENLLSDVLSAKIGQESHCPVVLVGHSIGGLVIKELCCQAYQKAVTSQGIHKIRLENFLNNLKGIFYYATPHQGSPVAEQLADIIGGPLLKYFKMLSKDTARLNYEFNHMCTLYDKCQFAGLGEILPTKLGPLQDVMVVPEASARGENFNVDEKADHFSICRPKNKKVRSFKKLEGFLADIVSEMKEQCHPDNFQRLPKTITGIGVQLQEVRSKLKDVKSVGLVGMGGLGKTTLAMALFNDLCLNFEYTSFVPRVKDKVDSVELEELVWNNMYYMGKKFGHGVPEWSKLIDKQVLLVLDDIAGDCDVTSLLDDTCPKSRLIVTSRERDLSAVDYVHDVHFLGEENARRLFMRHVFPSQEMAPTMYRDLMEAILRKCEGLPLTLEVLGQYLRRKQNTEDWKQTLNALDKAEKVKRLDERLWVKLKVSYDGLKDNEQKIFLDATTFFCSRMKWTLRDAKAAWAEAYDTDCVNLLWQTLVDMSLVYQIEEHESVQVHEQLQSLGRRIAAEKSNEYQCKVWDEDSILEQDGPQFCEFYEDVKKYPLCDRTLGVCPSRIPGSCPFLHKLKKQEVKKSVIVGNPEEAKSFLSKIFPLDHFGLHSFFASLPSRLVFLKLNCSTMQSLPSSIGQLLSLRTLILHIDFGYNNTITHIPDEIGQLSRLQVLEFDGFRSLVNLPETLGLLSELIDLRLTSCRSLGALPESFPQLLMLQHLELNFCANLYSLPESFGHLSKLQHLEFNFCGNLHCLPESFGLLSMLQHLDFSGCDNLHYLPESFGQLSTLQRLKLNFRNKVISQQKGRIRSTWGKKHRLSQIPIRFGEIERFSESLAGFMNLSHLEISDLGFRTIPDLRCLRSLHSFGLGFLPFVRKLPPWLEEIGVTCSALSKELLTFEKRDGRFFLTGESLKYSRVAGL